MILSIVCLTLIELGGVNNSMAYNDSVRNAEIVTNALQNDTCVRIQRQNIFYSLPISVENKTNVTFDIQGKLYAYPKLFQWPIKDGRYQNFLQFTDSDTITLTGGGRIDGCGWLWWLYALADKLTHSRPNLVVLERCNQAFIDNLSMSNSPQYHLNLKEVGYSTVQYVTVYVNTTRQMELLNKFNFPIFPLNTDGIDVSGKNIVITNCFIRNFDDAIAVKPLNSNNQLSSCSENIVITNSIVELGVGLSIGSVSPNKATNCVQNVTFDSITLFTPIKAIYIKTNPGGDGLGVIRHIRYSNIHWDEAIWYGIYIGPQQQKEPDGSGPGCMLYPLKKDCPTNPNVDISNISLINISSTKDLLYSGLIRCNETHPCQDIMFDNVQLQKPYLCEYANITYINSHPPLTCEE